MESKIIKLTQEQLDNFLREVTDSYFSHFDVYNYNNKHQLSENLNYYKVINKNKVNKQIVINEDLIKTYPTNITINYVYNNLKDYDVELLIPNEEQNDDSISNHIMVKIFAQQVDLQFELKLNKSFKTCGYALGASSYLFDDNGFKIKVYQFEPIFQNTVNDNLGKYIYHVTTKNKLDNILKNGFTPKNSNKVGFLYDGRCYFFLETDYVLDYLKQSQKTNVEFHNNERQENNDYVLIEVKTDNIKKHIKFYPDVNFPKNIAIFTYANIPPSEISNYYLFNVHL